MSNLKNYIENLGESIGKLGWISNNCGDAGLKLLLEDIEHELLQTHEYFRYHEEEGILTESNPE